MHGHTFRTLAFISEILYQWAETTHKVRGGREGGRVEYSRVASPAL